MDKRVALVTGGTGGIGTSICQELCEKGYKVVAGYYSGGNHEKAQNWQAKQKDQGYDIAISYADIKDHDSCFKSYLDICETLGSVDVLVNNAGITRDTTLRRMSVPDWQEVIETNLTGMFNFTQLCVDKMIEKGFGRVVNISSINGQKGQFGQTNYSAAKAGIIGFTKALAQELAAKSITVNAVAPGYIETEMVLAVPAEVREKIRKTIPVGRFGKPEEIARIISFLADEDAGFITGSTITANGGQYFA